MLISILVWYFIGVMGSVMIALGACMDGEGLDRYDVGLLTFLAIGGLGTFIIGLPLFMHWLKDEIK